MRRLLRVVRTEAGYSMTELLVVMVILGTVLAGLTTAFVGGSKAEVDLNRRVQAQIQAAGAFDRLRRDVHCAQLGHDQRRDDDAERLLLFWAGRLERGGK